MQKGFLSIYTEGLRHLPRWAKILGVIILTKVFILLVVFKLILMPDYLNTQYTTEKEKSNHVLDVLTTKP